ncbi:hypothetical protein QOT17_025473 [Balamuthia mandrillaris]
MRTDEEEGRVVKDQQFLAHNVALLAQDFEWEEDLEEEDIPKQVLRTSLKRLNAHVSGLIHREKGRATQGVALKQLVSLRTTHKLEREKQETDLKKRKREATSILNVYPADWEPAEADDEELLEQYQRRRERLENLLTAITKLEAKQERARALLSLMQRIDIEALQQLASESSEIHEGLQHSEQLAKNILIERKQRPDVVLPLLTRRKKPRAQNEGKEEQQPNESSSSSEGEGEGEQQQHKHPSDPGTLSSALLRDLLTSADEEEEEVSALH